ncbi:hypothetical protein HG263_08330 [Pseudoalteromonas sp. JBTF-M23]|uniref:Contractile injection system tube protein N-terminal domain-containing protein n=1 Tax=Pseudoalteromonas caenipelagi TaxID=2726988 RepID=A0A849VFP4_9GAMM|nr:hypothetical protein [Pseudoalteromonas caenipelagi]NOU50547.1 hypothetical protein [Pseudoalteromonas caenipelagi]
MNITASRVPVEIRAFKDIKRTGKANVFQLDGDPSSLQISASNAYDNPSTLNSISGDITYQRSNTTRASMRFILDAYEFKALSDLKLDTPDVSKQIKQLLSLLYTMEDSSHEPNYLILKWGDMPIGDSVSGGFYCRLESIEYHIVSADEQGKPIQAEVNCAFIECLSKQQRDTKVKKNSPDLSHIRPVQAKETLPFKSNEIYQDPRYYLEVARVNGLDNFRQLNTGDNLIFPPLER